MASKKYILLALCFFWIVGAWAQPESHQLGFSLMSSWEVPYHFTAVYSDRPAKEVISQRDYLWFVGLQYHCSYRSYVAPDKNFSISIGFPISVSAFLPVTSAHSVPPKYYVFLSAPMQVELNFGAGAKPGKGKIGGFVAVGAGIQFMRTRDYLYYDQTLHYTQFNPYGSLGLRFSILGRITQLSLGASYPPVKRKKMGEQSGDYGGDEVYFFRTLLRGTDVLAVTVFLGKNYLVKTSKK